LVVVAAAGHVWFRDILAIESAVRWETALRGYQQAFPRAVYVAAFLAYVILAGLSLPGAFILTVVFGWYFGFIQSLLLVSFASTTGASLAFLCSRYVLKDLFRSRFGARLRMFNDALARDGAFYLFTLRLVPAVPFFLVNLVMGLTPVTLGTFWWVSQIGMLPGTAIYAYAGASAPYLHDLSQHGVEGILSPQLILAFVLLGVFPLFAKLIVKRAQSRSRR
jgi:uncharacterized membrane protein YdjX (TVP38/TMEM64 family)